METSPNVGSDLVRIHKVITRALDVSLEYSLQTNLIEDYQQGFTSYVRSLVILLHAHHSGEDELAFPFWQSHFPSGPFDILTRQHHQMITYIDQTTLWTEMGFIAWHVDSLTELHRSLSNLQKLWEVHITLEEETIGPEKSIKSSRQRKMSN